MSFRVTSLRSWSLLAWPMERCNLCPGIWKEWCQNIFICVNSEHVWNNMELIWRLMTLSIFLFSATFLDHKLGINGANETILWEKDDSHLSDSHSESPCEFSMPQPLCSRQSFPSPAKVLNKTAAQKDNSKSKSGIFGSIYRVFDWYLLSIKILKILNYTRIHKITPRFVVLPNRPHAEVWLVHFAAKTQFGPTWAQSENSDIDSFPLGDIDISWHLTLVSRNITASNSTEVQKWPGPREVGDDTAKEDMTELRQVVSQAYLQWSSHFGRVNKMEGVHLLNTLISFCGVVSTTKNIQEFDHHTVAVSFKSADGGSTNDWPDVFWSPAAIPKYDSARVPKTWGKKGQQKFSEKASKLLNVDVLFRLPTCYGYLYGHVVWSNSWQLKKCFCWNLLGPSDAAGLKGWSSKSRRCKR